VKGKVSERQAATFDPLILWFSETYEIPPPNTSFELSIEHSEMTLTKVQWMLFGLDDWTLSALDSLISNLKSLVLSLAVWQRKILLPDALKAYRTEEDYQEENWGMVEGHHDLDKSNANVRISAAALFLHHLDPPKGSLFPHQTITVPSKTTKLNK